MPRLPARSPSSWKSAAARSMPPSESGATLLQIINRSQPSSPIRSNLRSARAKVRLRCGSGMPSKSRKGWNVTIFRPSSATMRATSFGVPLNDNKSLSKISTPVNPAAAVACSFSARPPLSDTVAIEVCMLRLTFGNRTAMRILPPMPGERGRYLAGSNRRDNRQKPVGDPSGPPQSPVCCRPSLSGANERHHFGLSGEAIMRLHLFFIAIIGTALLQAGGAQAQSAALTGQISSAAEPVMEGVLVSAKKADSAVTVTVVSDDKGRYSFPADRLEPGRYTISIRAIGYKLDGPKSAEVAAGTTATADLKLSPVKNLVTQLSSGEWLNSLPGEPKQKAFLTMCVGCHTLQRVLTSTHSPAEFEQVFLRMSRYSPGSTPTHPQPLLPGPRGERPAVTGDAAKAAAGYLASLTLGNAEATEYQFKPLPRPKGRATRVIVTEYDLPRKEAQPHDVIVDADGKT